MDEDKDRETVKQKERGRGRIKVREEEGGMDRIKRKARGYREDRGNKER